MPILQTGFEEWKASVNQKIQPTSINAVLTPDSGNNWQFIRANRQLSAIPFTNAENLCQAIVRSWQLYDGEVLDFSIFA